jgi:hypothetical protein
MFPAFQARPKQAMMGRKRLINDGLSEERLGLRLVRILKHLADGVCFRRRFA